MPELLTTMIGSLPFKSIDEAVEYSLSHDIPAVPELPELDGNMFSYLTYKKMPAAYDKFCEAARGRSIKRVKVQSVGPVTAVLHCGMSEEDSVNEISHYVNILLRGLDFIDTIYVCFDEPAINGRHVYPLFPDAESEAIDGVINNIIPPKDIRVIPMIHDCNDVSDRIGYFDDLGFKAVSFDATKYNIKYARGSFKEEYRKYRKSGGVLCFGAVSIREGLGIAQFLPSDAKDGDMISASCGFGNLSVDDCYKAKRILDDIKDTLR